MDCHLRVMLSEKLHRPTCATAYVKDALRPDEGQQG
jgi:hypothetical protein